MKTKTTRRPGDKIADRQKSSAGPAPRGFILFEGPSKLDQAPIVVIATLKTSNRKTGDMVQTWILRADQSPVEAVKTGADVSICGQCPHRAKDNRSCYVNYGQAPGAVYRGYKKGIYPHATIGDVEQYLEGRAIRFGAYGDPAAAPTFIWRMLAGVASIHTGYTHQASHKSFDPELAKYVMVSADSPKQAAKYQAKGYRTFRVKNPADTFALNEIECLADSEQKNCIDCGLCDGQSSAPNIAISVHGSAAVNFRSANVIAATS